MKEQKTLGSDDFSKIPNGAPGIETRMSLVYDGGVRTGRISLNRFVELTSTSPAKIFGLFPRKGTIAPGSDADIVIFDPNRKMTLSARTHHMKVDYNPYEGREVTGVTDTVLSRGRVIIENGKFVGPAGAGNFLKRSARSYDAPRALTDHIMTSDEIIALSKKHTIFEWSAQGAVDPIPVARSKGVYFWTPEGKRYLDFNSQLMCVNIGHADDRVVKAIQDQAAVAPVRQPVHGNGTARPAGREAGGDHARRHRLLLLHQRRRRGQRERHQGRALVHGTSQDSCALSLVSRRHGRRDLADGRSAAMGRRTWPAGHRPRAGSVSRHPARVGQRRAPRWRRSKRSFSSKGPGTIAGFILEPVTGTNGVLIPPDGYLQGVRALCDKHGIVMIADEVMSGFGRTGEVVRRRSLERRAGHLDDGEGVDERIRAAGRRGAAAPDRRPFPRSRVLRRSHLQQPHAGVRRRRWRRSRSTKKIG